MYVHLLDDYDHINPKEKSFTGFANFICHSKYNEYHANMLNLLSNNDDGAVNTTDATHTILRKSVKATKNEICSINTGDSSMLNSRGYTLESRIQIVEIAQYQDVLKLDVIKNSLDHYTTKIKLLLDERLQLINMAKIICPSMMRRLYIGCE